MEVNSSLNYINTIDKPASIGVIITYSDEKDFIVSAVLSVDQAISNAQAIFPNVTFSRVVVADSNFFDFEFIEKLDLQGWNIYRVEFNSLAKSRNFACTNSNSQYLCFLDADDLMGENWLKACIYEIRNSKFDSKVIYRPERIYYFDEIVKKVRIQISHSLRYFFLISKLQNQNIYISPHFSSTELLRLYPYPEKTDQVWEDWEWNILTISNGISQKVIPETFWGVRLRENSLSSKHICKLLFLSDLSHDLLIKSFKFRSSLLLRHIWTNFISINKIERFLNWFGLRYSDKYLTWYTSNYSDVEIYAKSPFSHFVKYGFFEGRYLFNPKFKLYSQIKYIHSFIGSGLENNKPLDLRILGMD
jgi:hypothetical protein